MAYNQAIAHVNNTDQLLAQQQKERNAEIEHEKQLAATHRAYAQSFDQGIGVANKSREIAIAFDNSFRKVNFDLEMRSIKAAHDSAVRNATQAAQGKAKQTQQVVNFVTQTLDTGVQIAQNIETGRQKQIAQDAQTFALEHGTVSLQAKAEIKKINLDLLNDDKRQAALTDIAARTGTPVLALQRYIELSPQVQTAVAHLSLTAELQNIVPNAWADTESKLDGRNYQEWRTSGLPEAPAAIGRLLDQKHAQIYRLFEESGNKINPQLSSSTTGVFAKNKASEMNAAMRLATQTVKEDYAVREEQDLANQINTIGIKGIGETWRTAYETPEERVAGIGKDLNTFKRLAESGYIGIEEINEIATLRGPGGGTLSEHQTFGGKVRALYAAWNANKVVSNQTQALQLKEDRMATFQMLNGLINSNEKIPMAQIESLERGLTQNKLLDGPNAALLEILVKRLDESPAAQTTRNVLLAAEGSGIVDQGALKRAAGGNMEAYISASNEAAKQLSKNQTRQLAYKNNESLVRRIGKFGDKDVTSSSEFNNAVDTLNKIWYDDVVRYAAEGKGMQYAYDQANANFKSLETAAEADPFGNHILKLNDLANNPKGGIFVKDFGVTDDIQPTRAISYTQLSGTFKSLGIDTDVKGYDRSAARKILIDNPDAFDYIETDVITDFINKMQLPNQAPSYASISLFDKVAVKAGYTNGYVAAKDMLKSRGITLEANPADAITEQLFKQYGIGVNQIGVGNAYDLSQGRTLVRGEVGDIRYDYIQPDTQGNLRGFDLAPTGSDYTHALFPGKVIDIGHQFNPNATGGDGRPGAGWGWHVFIRHVNPKTGEEYDMVYAHFPKNSIQVKVGQTVSQGQILGPMATNAQFTNDRPNVGSGNGVHMSVDMFEKDSHTPYRNWRQIGDLIRGLGRGGTQQQPQQPQQQQPPLNERQSIGELPIVSDDGEMPIVKPLVDPLNNPEEAKSSYRLGGDKIITKLPDGSYAVRHWVNGNWSDPVALNQDEGKTMYEQGRYLATKGVTNQ